MVKEKVLNAKMREIVRLLHKTGGAMTAHEIARETGFSYSTVIKYLNELHKLGLIKPREGGTAKKKTNKK